MEQQKSLNVMKCVLVKETELKYTTKSSPCDTIANVLFEYGLNSSAEEKMVVVCLDVHMNIIGLHEVAHGGINGCAIRMADIYKRALLNNAYGIVIAHNHPGGKASPSHEDVVITDKIIEAGKLLGIDCMDHIIVTIDNYYSLREHDDACFE